MGSYLPKRILGLGLKPALKDAASLIMRTSLRGSPSGLAENRHGPSAGMYNLDSGAELSIGSDAARTFTSWRRHRAG